MTGEPVLRRVWCNRWFGGSRRKLELDKSRVAVNKKEHPIEPCRKQMVDYIVVDRELARWHPQVSNNQEP